MDALLERSNALEATYSQIYADLAELRESFHRSGRLDDSNAKLDEISKLFATFLAYRRDQISSFPSADALGLISALQEAFRQTAELPQYRLKAGGSIFGTNPSLAIRNGDEPLARDLVSLVTRCVNHAYDMRNEEHPFDILNEAFGHFVRDNFRGNVEDAQYMTPPEVVDFVVDVALLDLQEDSARDPDPNRAWTVLDPTCGVGSFLTSFYHRARSLDWLDERHLRLFGQDKVERMVRLSTINMELFEVGEHQIYIGNSLEKGSEIDALNGQVDLILTNPPFGARFDHSYVVANCGNNTPFFSSLKRTNSTLDSELLFVDRNMRLLKDGGRLLIVVPDGVVSAKGMAALLRSHLAKTSTVVSVIELPPTAFAQAGTRTKTAVLYLRKGHDAAPAITMMATVKDLGFQVSSRKGVQIKVAVGKNQLPAVYDAHKRQRMGHAFSVPTILHREPSCVLVSEEQVTKGDWTPSHHNALRFETVSQIRQNVDFDLVPLSELVTFCSEARRPEAWRDGLAYISVLHILGDGFVDVAGALAHAPKTPGIRTERNEILISRINPRIPRVCVTPDLGKKTLCSTEFEVMRCNSGVDVYGLAYVLQTEIVQNQIQCLTSGTSASHNRIRTSELAQVLIPVIKHGSSRAAQLNKVFSEYGAASRSLVANALQLAALRSRDTELFADVR